MNKNNNIFMPSQSAYRENHLTEIALFKVNNDLIQNRLNSHPTILLLLDLSAAFDTIDQNLLLNDLEFYGCSTNSIALMRSYLFQRSQKIVINGCLSDAMPLKYGVPQGSKFGPLLFSIYVSSLHRLIKGHGIDYHCYADDT